MVVEARAEILARKTDPNRKNFFKNFSKRLFLVDDQGLLKNFWVGGLKNLYTRVSGKNSKFDKQAFGKLKASSWSCFKKLVAKLGIFLSVFFVGAMVLKSLPPVATNFKKDFAEDTEPLSLLEWINYRLKERRSKLWCCGFIPVNCGCSLRMPFPKKLECKLQSCFCEVKPSEIVKDKPIENTCLWVCDTSFHRTDKPRDYKTS